MLVLNVLLLVDITGLRADALHELIHLVVQNHHISLDSDVILSHKNLATPVLLVSL